jgi:hypothetical protein
MSIARHGTVDTLVYGDRAGIFSVSVDYVGDRFVKGVICCRSVPERLVVKQVYMACMICYIQSRCAMGSSISSENELDKILISVGNLINNDRTTKKFADGVNYASSVGGNPQKLIKTIVIKPEK